MTMIAKLPATMHAITVQSICTPSIRVSAPHRVYHLRTSAAPAWGQ
jgi:hypothetical protein